MTEVGLADSSVGEAGEVGALAEEVFGGVGGDGAGEKVALAVLAPKLV